MRILDKYELAKCNVGTPFYVLEKTEGTDNKDYNIRDGLQILDSEIKTTHNGITYFNGVCPLLPSPLYDEYPFFNENELPKFELYSDDTDSNDFDDNDRFLVLNADELKVIIDELTEFYERLKKEGF